MSATQIVACPNMTLVIKRLTDYTVKHMSGMSNIPHLCVKVRHHNGFAWFGVNVVGITDKSPWSRQLEEQILGQFEEAMRQIVDLEALESDIPLLLRSLQDITTGRKRPVLFGGKSNEFIQVCAPNNVQIEVYRKEVKQESVTYGGYFLTVDVHGHTYPVVVYHRGIILYNYIGKEAVQQLVREELCGNFPEVFPYNDTTIRYDEITQLPRNRSKRA